MSNARNLSDIVGGNFDIPAGSLDNAVPANGSITTAKLADDAVTSAKIADDAVVAAALATDAVTADALSASAIARADLPTGSILQVKQAVKKDTTVQAAGSFTDVSGLSISITPTAQNSQFLLICSLASTMYNNTVQMRFKRDSTTIGIGDNSGNRTRTSAGQMQPDDDGNHQQSKMVSEFVDVPNTTGAITYKVQHKTQSSGTTYINRSVNDANNGDWSHRTISTFTVLEIRG